MRTNLAGWFFNERALAVGAFALFFVSADSFLGAWLARGALGFALGSLVLCEAGMVLA